MRLRDPTVDIHGVPPGIFMKLHLVDELCLDHDTLRSSTLA
jgi:hypothetical protein